MKLKPTYQTLLFFGCALALAGCSGSDSNVPPPIPITGQLNDTGIRSCSGAEEPQEPCPQPDFPNQDAQFGRDAQGQQLQKTGAGTAGYDWTKIDSTGSPLPLQTAGWEHDGSEQSGTRWSCVEDNVTQLLWEVKESDPDHPRYSEHSYTWYNDNPATNGGFAGVADGGICATPSCDTKGYVEWINEQGLCGHNDWRLPTVRELSSIAVIANVLPAMDTDYFANASQPRFFTALTNAKDANHAWYVYFSDGSVSSTGKADASHLRLVRGQQQ